MDGRGFGVPTLVPHLPQHPGLTLAQTVIGLAGGNEPPNPLPPKNFGYDYPMPSLTADSVVFNQDKVLLIRRGKDPFKHRLALPGGFVNEGETSRDAAQRELREETGLTITTVPRLINVYDSIGRDPRGWVVSHAYLFRTRQVNVVGSDDAVEALWLPLNKISKSELAFDHWTIINDAWELERSVI